MLSTLENIDRRVIYLLVFIGLSIPLIAGQTMRPAEMKESITAFSRIEKIAEQENPFVLVAMDWGPSTSAENLPQTHVMLEHIMRRQVPFALISVLPYAKPYMESLPEEILKDIQKDSPEINYVYGKDWVDFGYQPNFSLMVNQLAKADFHEFPGTDAKGNKLSDLELTKKFRSIHDLSGLIEVTGLSGAMDMWIQLFNRDGYTRSSFTAALQLVFPTLIFLEIQNSSRGS